MPEDACPTFVRFGGVDCIYGVMPDALYFSLFFGFVYRGTLADRERSMDSGSVSVGNDQLPAKMVKCAPEILQGISSNRCQLHGGRRNAANIVEHLSRLRIALVNDSIWAGRN